MHVATMSRRNGSLIGMTLAVALCLGLFGQEHQTVRAQDAGGKMMKSDMMMKKMMMDRDAMMMAHKEMMANDPMMMQRVMREMMLQQMMADPEVMAMMRKEAAMDEGRMMKMMEPGGMMSMKESMMNDKEAMSAMMWELIIRQMAADMNARMMKK